MKSLLLSALQTIVRALIGSIRYDEIKQLVERVETNEERSGAEKRALVLTGCQVAISLVGTALVNLAIEVAVQSLRKG